MMTTGRPGWTFAVLNLLGAIAVGYALWPGEGHPRPLWATVLAFVAVVSWALRGIITMLPRGDRPAIILSAVAALSGGFAAGATHGLTVVPAAIGTLAVVGALAVPLGYGLALAVLSCGAIALGAVIHPTEVPDTLTMMGGVLLSAVAGFSRRQFRLAEDQAALLRERELLVRQETERVALARDLHDVLAHSLGGLVIQLDAVEALLEAGERDAALQRVSAARGLAAEGLNEARRAVAALRSAGHSPASEGDEGQKAPGLSESMDQLIEAHRSLGGVVDLAVHGLPASLSAEQQDAVQRALQEGLSNARKHAPGEPVRVLLDWQNDRVQLTISNPLVDDSSAPSRAAGGYGLLGMRERFAALSGGGTVDAGVRGDRFVVAAEAML
ncbi:histidine kinase [Arthrobacter sp. NPDC090010]|uniref:histidine kinase n=1 Tax=Arthrobacter sp. NPDC090010 TaxID=3363942 RepID=UPI00380AF9D3